MKIVEIYGQEAVLLYKGKITKPAIEICGSKAGTEWMSKHLEEEVLIGLRKTSINPNGYKLVIINQNNYEDWLITSVVYKMVTNEVKKELCVKTQSDSVYFFPEVVAM